ncbi:MAG TPA: sulfatase [Pirellulales bacterium]|nr:sulfatase [Pirellulales bacterium]
MRTWACWNTTRRGWLALAIVSAVLSSIGDAEARPPNVVFFLVDDLGQRDLGCYGSTFYETPNIDRLADEGVRFTSAYAAAPICSPTRASILTGQWPQRVGITDAIGTPAGDEWKRNTKLLPATYADRLPLESPTIAKALKAAGYATFFAGKWHLGPKGYWPKNQGFDQNIGGTEAGHPHSYFSPYENENLPDGPKGEYLPERLAAETVNFIEAHKDRPFLAYLSFYAVHNPMMPREDLKQKYEAKRHQLGLSTRWGREGERDVRLVQDYPAYAAMVEAVDIAVGKVLARLDALGLSENTLVIFTSDNGGLSTSEGWPTSNVPLRGGKGWLYEGGIREPLLIRWPKLIHVGAATKPGSTIDAPVISPDFLPTVLDATGVRPQASQTLDGVSLLPLLRGKSLAQRALYWHFPHYNNQGGAPAAAIQRGDWKLIEWQEDHAVELYDIAHDLSETNNLAAKEPDRVAQLRGELHAWQKDVGATFPTTNAKYDPSKPDGRSAKRVARPDGTSRMVRPDH